MKETRLKGVYQISGKTIATKNLARGISVYGEKIFCEQGEEFREWNPFRSKLAAAIRKGISQIGIKPGDVVLYLGASTGTTSSHVSDIVGEKGFIFALDFAPRVVRELVWVCESRKNMTALLEDASIPESYAERVTEVDAIYQDIAQKDQVEILIKNCRLFLKKGGFAILCVKARSIDVTKHPKNIFKEVKKKLEKEMIIADYRELEPFEKDHAIFICKYK